MYEKIWNSAPVLLEDDANLCNIVYPQFLETIEEILIPAIDGEDVGGWESSLTLNATSTYTLFMNGLLTGPCKTLAQNRMDAIKEGRSIARYEESYGKGRENRDITRVKIEAELNTAKESGLNSTILYQTWLRK